MHTDFASKFFVRLTPSVPGNLVNRGLFIVAVTLGLIEATGNPAGIAISLAMPCVCLAASSRKSAFEAALGFFAAGLWPMLPGLERYFGTTKAPLLAAVIWVTCASILASPWALCWTKHYSAYLWRVPLTVLVAIVPPIGLIDFLSPLTSAGLIFPGCGWLGLLFTALMPGSLLALPRHRSRILPVFALLSIAANVRSQGKPRIAGWEAINTSFGDVSLPFKDYEVAQVIQSRSQRSLAKVLIFPECVIPRWSEATEAFWKGTLVQAETRGQIVAVGAGLPRPVGPARPLPNYDFESSIAAIVDAGAKPFAGAFQPGWPEPFDNTLLILGKEKAIYRQRIPVPLGMWRPWTSISVPLRLQGSGVVNIDGQRAAVLICYEQLIAWPVLLSLRQRPSVLVGISNTFWFNGTAIPRYQDSSIHAWARLFSVPVLTAVNS